MRRHCWTNSLSNIMSSFSYVPSVLSSYLLARQVQIGVSFVSLSLKIAIGSILRILVFAQPLILLGKMHIVHQIGKISFTLSLRGFQSSKSNKVKIQWFWMFNFTGKWTSITLESWTVAWNYNTCMDRWRCIGELCAGGENDTH